MGKCPNCNKEVYFGRSQKVRRIKGKVGIAKLSSRAERVPFKDRDYHKTCFRCAHCNKVLKTNTLTEHKGKIYCEKPCYNQLFGPHGKK